VARRLAFGPGAAILPRMPTVDLGEDSQGDESETAWLRALLANEVFAYLRDPAEDIYTAEDCEPFRDSD
jgi:hypothetical protein